MLQRRQPDVREEAVSPRSAGLSMLQASRDHAAELPGAPEARDIFSHTNDRRALQPRDTPLSCDEKPPINGRVGERASLRAWLDVS